MQQILIRAGLWILLPPRKDQEGIERFHPPPYIHTALLTHFKSDVP